VPQEIPDRCRFIQADVLDLEWQGDGFLCTNDGYNTPIANRFDFICASSPCEQFSIHGMKHFHPNPPYPELGIKLGLMLAQSHSPAQATAQVRISRLTANPAEDRIRAAAISRDGKYLAFSDETGFYLRQIDTGETHPLALPAGLAAGSISWFPDSAHLITTLSGPGQSSSLWEISTLGGNARKLIDDGRFPAVSPDGKQIAYITGLRLGNQIWLAAANGEQPSKLLGEEGDFFGSVTWSPDSTRVAYIRGRLTNAYGLSGVIEYVNVRGHQKSVNVADRQANVLYQLTGMGWFSAISGPLAWASDGRLIYAQAEPPPRQLDSNLCRNIGQFIQILHSEVPASSLFGKLAQQPGAVKLLGCAAAR